MEGKKQVFRNTLLICCSLVEHMFCMYEAVDLIPHTYIHTKEKNDMGLTRVQ